MLSKALFLFKHTEVNLREKNTLKPDIEILSVFYWVQSTVYLSQRVETGIIFICVLY